MTTIHRHWHGPKPTGFSTPHFDHILSKPQMGVGSFQWCLKTNQTEISPALWRILGLPTTSSSDGKGFLEFLHPKQRAKASKDIRKAVNSGKTAFEKLYRMCAAADQIQISLIRARIVRIHEIATRIDGVVIDVTTLPSLLMSFE